MKRILLLSSLLVSGLSLYASPLSPQEALNRARAAAPRTLKSDRHASPRLVHTRLTPDDKAAFYVFDNPSQNGYMIVSADDCARPLLGYTDKGSFNAEDMSPELEWWLNEYAAQIDYASNQSSKNLFVMPSRSAESARQPIAPMIKTKWDQVAPYNDQCPLSGTERTYTGCVATAMAQVMNYWQYPERGTGSITYTIPSLEKKVTMNFGNKPFDWANMKDSYLPGSYDEAQANAVAYLMKACGYSVKMDYSMDASGALAMNISNAFNKYFNYDPNILYTLRAYHSADEWDRMFYENLRDVGPILVGGGSALGGGHSFICDGYDGEGYYHFNWGWSGMSDGYFALDALNPDALGAGGGTGGGYNFSQDAVLKLQPPTGQPANPQPLFLTQSGGVAGAIEGSTLTFSLNGEADPMWINYTPSKLQVKFGVNVTKSSDAQFQPVYHDISPERFVIEPGYGTNPKLLGANLNLDALNLTDGTYTLTIGTCPVTSSTPDNPTDGTGFQPVKPYYGYTNSIILNVSGSSYSVTNSYKPELKVTAEITSPLYYACLMSLKVTATNDSDIELSSGFAPAFADSNGILFLGESISVSVPPHSQVTREWTTSLEQFQTIYAFEQPRKLAFTLFDEESFTFYTDQFSKTVEMKPNPGVPSVEVSTPMEMPGTTREPYQDGNIRTVRYVVSDPMNIKVTAGLKLKEGYFHYPALACICLPADGPQVEIALTSAKAILLSEPGQTADFSTTIGYPVYDPDITYYMVLAYAGPAGITSLANPMFFRIKDTAGVGELEAAEGIFFCIDRASGLLTVTSDCDIESIQAYDMSGRLISSGKDFNSHAASISLPSEGVFTIVAADAAGNTKTTKIIR